MDVRFALEEGSCRSCHAVTVAESTSGLVAAFFGGSCEGADDVRIGFTRLQGARWAPPRFVADGRSRDGRRHACWNPVLHVARDGTLILFYKVGPTCSGWWGMVTRSRDGGETWSPPEQLPVQHWGPIRNKIHRLPDGTLLCPSSTELGAWRVHFERCDDHGHGWSRTPSLADPEGLEPIQPTVLDHGNGRLQALCRTYSASILAETWSEDHGATWSPLARTRLPNPNSAVDGLRLRDGRFLLALNPTQVRPRRGSGERTPLVLAVGHDGVTWDGITVIEQGAGEFSYPAVIQDAAGAVHLLYTRHRNSIAHVALDPVRIGRDGEVPLVGGTGRPAAG